MSAGDDLLVERLGELCDALAGGAAPDPEQSGRLAEQFDVPTEKLAPCLEAVAALNALMDDALAPPPRPPSTRPLGPADGGPILIHPRYRQSGYIDQGGMGVVLQATDPELGREVAIKLLRAGALASRLERQKFIEEGRITGQLQHPNIVPVHDIGKTVDGRAFIAMKRVEGRTLAQAISELAQETPGGPLLRAQRGLLHAFLKVCDAVSYAHARGVIHRDLKPGNIMLGAHGEVLVMDWGLARQIGRPAGPARPPFGGPPPAPPAGPRATTAQTASDPAPLTAEGSIVGTLPYMSPEQASGRISELDARSDVYALGGILYTILTLELPFVGTGPLLVQRVRAGPPEPPTERAPWALIPIQLEGLVMTAMAQEPGDRYADADALRRDVKAYLEGRPLSALDYSPAQVALKWAGRHLAATLTGAVALLALLLTSGLFVWRLELRRAEAERHAAEVVRRAQRDHDLLALGRLRETATRLWPAVPSRLEALRRWRAEATDLLGRQARHAAALVTVDDDGRPALQGLVDGLVALRDLEQPSIARRIVAAERVEALASTQAEAWQAARAEIADPSRCPAYRGLQLRRQEGLAPLGRDPTTGLHEFAHLPTGEAPRRKDGRLELTPESAVVLVLIPGGRYPMGAIDGPRRHTDGQAEPRERPRHQVTLAPFFIARHEMTQAQWERAGGGRPSANTLLDGDGPFSLHPVERVSWTDCRQRLPRVGLRLPTEAQWEAAARGGTPTVWWCHDQVLALQGAANLSDKTLGRTQRFHRLGLTFEPWLVDGHAGHAPVDTFRANAYGLHSVIGNVREWCRDVPREYVEQARSGDGERVAPVGERWHRAARGASFLLMSRAGRMSARHPLPPGMRAADLGVRPARAVE